MKNPTPTPPITPPTPKPVPDPLKNFNWDLFVGHKVKHIKYGIGIIKKCDKKSMMIEFPLKTTTFMIPIAFNRGLAFIDEEINTIMVDIIKLLVSQDKII